MVLITIEHCEVLVTIEDDYGANMCMWLIGVLVSSKHCEILVAIEHCEVLVTSQHCEVLI